MHWQDPTPAADSPTACADQKEWQPPVHPECLPTDREEISMGDYHNRGEFTMEQSRTSPKLQRQEDGKQWPERERFEAKLSWQHPPSENVSTQKRLKSSKVTDMTLFKTPGWNRGGKWLSGTLTMQWPIEPLNRVTFRHTACVEAPRASLHLNHSLFITHCTLITSSSALDTGLAAPLQETSPLAPYKKERLADRKSSRPSTLCMLNFFQELCEESVNNLNSVSWHFIQIDSFQDPKSRLYGSDSKHIRNWLLSRPCAVTVYGKNIRNWLISRPSHLWTQIGLIPRPSCFGLKLTHFRTHTEDYPKHHPIDSFQDPHIGLLQCFNLHGRLPAKSPWETSSIHNSSKHPTQWISDFIVKQRRKTHHMQVINTFQHPGATCSTPDTTIFIKTNSFQDPRNFTSTVDSNIRLKTLAHRHQHRTRTPLPFISQICTYSLVTLSSLRAHYVP